MIPHPPKTKWMDVQIMKVEDEKHGLVVPDNFKFSLHLWVWKGASDWVQCWMVWLDTLKPLSAAA